MRRRRRGRYCSIFSRVSGQQGLRPASPSSSRSPLVSLAVSWGNEGKEEWDRRLRKVQREGGSVFSSSRRFFKESGALSHSVITVTLFSLFPIPILQLRGGTLLSSRSRSFQTRLRRSRTLPGRRAQSPAGGCRRGWPGRRRCRSRR